MASGPDSTVHRVPIAIREFQPEDYPAIVDISNAADPDHPTTIEETRDDDREYEGTDFVHKRIVAVVPAEGQPVAAGEYFHMAWAFDPARFGIWIAVHPERQGRGIGGALYDRLTAELRIRGAKELRTWAQESRIAAVRFLEHRGFKEMHRGWESRLALTSFDLAKFDRYWNLPRGIELTTLRAELANDPKAVEKVHEMDNELSLDVPGVDPFTPAPLAMFRHRILESPRSLPEAHFLAKDGDRYVGVSNLERNETLADVLHTGFTGVRREYRGRGIAFALKLRGIDYAIRRGIREIRTWNSTVNAPMLGINMKLGFVKQPAWLVLGKDLEGS